jgi:replicative DNA helicase
VTAKPNQQHLRLVADTSDAKPPHDMGAEQAVISASMLDAAAMKRCRDILAPEHFYADAHRLIWGAMCAVADRGAAVDLVTVVRQLRPNHIERAGGPRYVGQIIDSTPAVANVLDHARIVRQLAGRRDIIEKAQSVASKGYGAVQDEEQFAADAARDFSKLAADSAQLAAEPESIGSAAKRAVAEVYDNLPQPGQISGATTGLDALDEATAGMHPGDYVCLTGKTGRGKTALAGSIALNLAEAAVAGLAIGGGVGFCSLEQRKSELAARMACAKGRVNWHTIRLGHAKPADYTRLVDGSQGVADLPILVDDERPRKVRSLFDVARKMARTLEALGFPMRLFVVDYLQKVDGSDEVGPRDSRERALAKVAELMIELAAEMRCCVLGLAQLNDNDEVRDSRALVHEATGWWDLHVDNKSKGKARPAHVQVRKQRHAPYPATAPFWFHPAHVYFSDKEHLS